MPFAFLVPRTVGLEVFRVFRFKCSGSTNNIKNEQVQIILRMNISEIQS